MFIVNTMVELYFKQNHYIFILCIQLNVYMLFNNTSSKLIHLNRNLRLLDHETVVSLCASIVFKEQLSEIDKKY